MFGFLYVWKRLYCSSFLDIIFGRYRILGWQCIFGKCYSFFLLISLASDEKSGIIWVYCFIMHINVYMCILDTHYKNCVFLCWWFWEVGLPNWLCLEWFFSSDISPLLKAQVCLASWACVFVFHQAEPSVAFLKYSFYPHFFLYSLESQINVHEHQSFKVALKSIKWSTLNF